MVMSAGGRNKLMEECGELIVELAKKAAFPDGEHPDGKGDIDLRIEDEIADVYAALSFYIDKHNINTNRITRRYLEKWTLLRKWDNDPNA